MDEANIVKQTVLREIYNTLELGDISFRVLFSIVKESIKPENQVHLVKITLCYAEYLCNQGYVEVGEYHEKEEGLLVFAPWNLSIKGTFERINKLWEVVNFSEPDIGDIECYFKLKENRSWGQESIKI